MPRLGRSGCPRARGARQSSCRPSFRWPRTRSATIQALNRTKIAAAISPTTMPPQVDPRAARTVTSGGFSVEDGRAAAQERRHDAGGKRTSGEGGVAAAAGAVGGFDRPARVGVHQDEVRRSPGVEWLSLAGHAADLGRSITHPVGYQRPYLNLRINLIALK